MRVLVVGPDGIDSSERSCVRGLTELGHTAEVCDLRRHMGVPRAVSRSYLLTALAEGLLRATVREPYYFAQRHLVDRARAFGADLVLVIQLAWVLPRTITTLREAGVSCAGWFPDAFTSFGRGTFLLAPWNALFFQDPFIVERLRTSLGAEHVHHAYLFAGGLSFLVTTVFLLYVLSVGGDFMGLYRFVLPVVPLNVLCGALGLLRLTGSRPPLALAAAAALLLAHAANTFFIDRHALTFIGADRGIDTPGYLRHYTNDRAAIGKWLGQHVQPDDYQVVGGAGAQVYYAGIRALDSFGLSDAYVAHKVAASSVRPGHQKFAPLDYVLSRKPTILTYNVYRFTNEPFRPTPAEAAQWRAHGFHYVTVQIPGLSSPYYSFLKRIDRRLGPLPPETEQSP